MQAPGLVKVCVPVWRLLCMNKRPPWAEIKSIFHYRVFSYWTRVICATLNLCGCKIWLQSLTEKTRILSCGKSNKILWCWTFTNDLSIHKKLEVSKESCNKLTYEFIYYPSWEKKKKPKVKPFKLGEYFTNLFQVQ